jgi:hypothetical protein
MSAEYASLDKIFFEKISLLDLQSNDAGKQGIISPVLSSSMMRYRENSLNALF